MSRRRTTQEIEELLERYRTSGMTRIAYCQKWGLRSAHWVGIFGNTAAGSDW